MIGVLVAAVCTTVPIGPAGAAPGSTSAERLVSPVPHPANQTDADIAYDGSTFLVVWRDQRNGNSDIYGARLDSTGRVIDVDGIPISTAAGEQDSPAVTSTGSGFLVVWSDDRNGASSDIYGARIGDDGSVLDPGGFPISTATSFQTSPDVAFDGTEALVVWADGRSIGSWDVYGARVSGATVLEPSGIAISTATSFQWEPAVAFSGTSFMVVWEDGRNGDDQRDIYASRVGTDGVVAHTSGFAVSATAGNEVAPDIAWNGANYLVAWGDATGVAAALLTRGGNIEVPDIRLPASGGVDAHVAAGNGSFLVVWSDGSVKGARVSSNGDVVDAKGKGIAAGFATNIAFGAGSHRVVLQVGPVFGPDDIASTRVTPAFTVLDAPARLVSLRSAFQDRPAIAFDGTNHLVTWSDDRTGSSHIYVARTSPGGQLLDQAGVALTALAGSDYFPSVAFDGTRYLVVWKHDPSGSGNADIYGQRVTKAGAPAGDAFVISGATNDQSEPAVTFDGTRFVVVWTDYRNGDTDIYGSRVSPFGTVLDPAGIPVSTATGSQSAPDITSDGTGSFVVWGDGRNATNDVYGSRISTAGTVLDPAGIGVQTDGFNQFRPSVAFGGGGYLVAWDESGNIWGSRVTTAGAVQDPGGILITTAGDNQDSPTVAFKGTFLVAWEDRRSGSTYDVYGTRVDGDGAVKDPSGLALSTGPTDELSPALAPSSAGWSVVYSHTLGTGTGIHERTVSPK